MIRQMKQLSYKKGSSRYDGQKGENAAEGFLKEKGIRILEKNFRCRAGEIDMIGLEGDTYVFFEVKYRRKNYSGEPYEAVGYKKQRKICLAADFYRMIHRLSEDTKIRFDVVSILGDGITWYKNAFYYIRRD